MARIVLGVVLVIVALELLAFGPLRGRLFWPAPGRIPSGIGSCSAGCSM